MEKPFELTKEQKEELKEAFEVFDADGDGHINAQELRVVLEAAGRNMTEEEVQAKIAEVDDDGAGELEWDEFLNLMTEEMRAKQTDEELIEAFKYFGPNNDQEGITKEQLREVLEQEGEKVTDDDIELLFEETSISGKGAITFSDFMLMMMAK